MTIPNGEFLEMVYAVETGRWEVARRDAESHVRASNGSAKARG